MKRALWVTLGVRGNAGDALLYQVTEALFDGLVDLDFRSINEPRYLRRGDGATDDVILGPGGILVQTNSSRHLHGKLAKQWDQFEGKRFHLWSTGILHTPTAEELAGVRRITARSRRIVVRARIEADLVRKAGPVTSPEWAPCTSLFSDRLLPDPTTTKDVVVLNLDELLFTEENIADHPLRRFIAFAEAQGLEVRSMVNASGDSNRMQLDLIPLIDIDQPHFDAMLQREATGKDFHESFNAALAGHPSFAARYNDCRFAFGKRLHAWLPFLAYDKPAAFVGMQARRGMPEDYFGDDTFLCDVPRATTLSTAQLDRMADRMIAKLQQFMDHEDALTARIAERREELWTQLQEQAAQFADGLG